MSADHASTRDLCLDIALGLALTAIEISHVARGLLDAGLLDHLAYSRWDRALYLVQLSVFVFIAGALAPRSLERPGPWPYLRQRLSLLLYVYVLWSVPQMLVRAAAAGLRWGALRSLFQVPAWNRTRRPGDVSSGISRG